MKELKRYEIPLLGEFVVYYKGNNIKFKDSKRFLCYKGKDFLLESDDFDDLQKTFNLYINNLYEKESKNIKENLEKVEKIKMSKDFSGDNWLNDWEIK